MRFLTHSSKSVTAEQVQAYTLNVSYSIGNFRNMKQYGTFTTAKKMSHERGTGRGFKVKKSKAFFKQHMLYFMFYFNSFEGLSFLHIF